MSHITKIELKVTSLPALGRAAARLGCQLIEGQTTHRYFYGAGACTHAIRVNRGSGQEYEIGVLALQDGSYDLAYDGYKGGHGLESHVGVGAMKLRQWYAAEVAMETMGLEGYMANVTEEADGRLRVRCTQ